MSAQLATSIARFVIPALASAALAGIGVWQQTRSIEGAVIAFLVPLLTTLAGAAGWGQHDANRARRGDVQPADVGAQPPPPPVPLAHVTGHQTTTGMH